MRRRHHAALVRKRKRDKARKERRKQMERDRDRRTAAVADSDSEKMRMCARKMRYSTKIDALMAASRVTLKKSVALRTYRCPICGGWHLTKYKNRK